MTYQTRELLRTATVYIITFAVIALLAVGYNFLLNIVNAGVESNCTAAGGQVLVTPGEVSMCLQPAR